jgi:hypothetical protein
MTNLQTPKSLALGAAILVLAATHDVSAQSLPNARDVLAKYAAATNAIKIESSPGHSSKGTLEIGGLKGTLEGYSDHKGRATQFVSIMGFEVRSGMEPTFSWSIEPASGPKVVEGKEFEQQKERDDPRAMRRDPALVIDAQTLERTTVEGESCVKLKLKWKSGRETTECYSDKTGLLLLAEGTETSAAAEMAVSTIYSEYKTFDGVTMPTKTVQRAAQTEAVIRLTEVVFGPIDPAKFAVPPEIQALRKK